MHGSAGDAAGYGYAGRADSVWRGSAGYRAGIHMKAYQEKKPLPDRRRLRRAAFWASTTPAELIVVLGLDLGGDAPIVGNFCGTGMHGGKIFLRCDALPPDLPAQVSAHRASESDLTEIRPYLERYEAAFSVDLNLLMKEPFWILTPNAKNPYHQLYTQQ